MWICFIARNVKSGIKTVNGYDAKVNIGQQNKHIPELMNIKTH